MNEFSRLSEIHAKAIIIDGHSDWSIEMARWRLRGETRVIERRHLPDMRAGGVTAEVLTVGGDTQVGPLWGPSLVNVFKMIDMVHQEVQESPDKLQIGRKADDVLAAKRSGRFAIIMSLEGLKPIDNTLSLLRTLWRLGLRVVGLTWNGRNEVADGCGEAKPARMSNFGREVLVEAEKLGLLVDVSHLSEPSFKDVLEITNGPVIASHSNVRALCEHNRNLSDEQIMQIAEKGGTIGINFFPGFIARPDPSFGKLLDHVDYLAKLVGTKHVAIGPDYTEYANDYLSESSKQMESAGIALDLQYKFLGDADSVSKLMKVTEGLNARGYSDLEVQGILGGNLLRVFERVFG